MKSNSAVLQGKNLPPILCYLILKKYLENVLQRFSDYQIIIIISLCSELRSQASTSGFWVSFSFAISLIIPNNIPCSKAYSLNIAAPSFLWLVSFCMVSIFSHSFIFNLLRTLYFKCVSDRQHGWILLLSNLTASVF